MSAVFRRLSIASILAVSVLLIILAMLSFFSRKPTNLGVRAGALSECPDRPNCVSTFAEDPRHAIEPLRFEGSAKDAWDILRKALDRQPRTRIVHSEQGYLHAEARSRLLRFVDDLEFKMDEESGLIHFRSASRVGFSDLGVNRRRAEEIRALFAELSNASGR